MNLSDFEIDVMTVIWRLGESTAPQVHEAVESTKPVTYSTVKTIIDRLEAKGAIKRTRTEGRTIFFEAAVAPSAIQSTLLEKLLNTVFAGDRRPLFSALLQAEELTKEDLDYLTGLVAQRRGELDDD